MDRYVEFEEREAREDRQEQALATRERFRDGPGMERPKNGAEFYRIWWCASCVIGYHRDAGLPTCCPRCGAGGLEPWIATPDVFVEGVGK